MLTHHSAQGKLKLFHLEDGGFNHQRDYKLNNLPIKILGYLTPNEVWHKKLEAA
jgi:hypothetical protein